MCGISLFRKLDSHPKTLKISLMMIPCGTISEDPHVLLMETSASGAPSLRVIVPEEIHLELQSNKL